MHNGVRKRSIRFRLTVWYAVILAAGLSLFSGLIWLSLRHRLMEEIDQDLAGRASRFERYFDSESTHAADDQLRDELEEFCQAFPPSSYVEVRGANGFTFHYPENARDAGGECSNLAAAVHVQPARFSTWRLPRPSPRRYTPSICCVCCCGA